MNTLNKLFQDKVTIMHIKRGAKYWKNSPKKRKLPVSPDFEERLPVHQYISETTRPDNRVYTWGYAELGALGHKQLLRPTNGRAPYAYLHRPMRLPFAELNQVTDIACGYGFTVLAVRGKDHQLFGCGINTDSQIGLQEARRGHALERVIYPAPIALPLDDPTAKVVQVACGRAHTAVVTSDGAVYTLGNNAYGQCGRPVIENERYQASDTVHRVQLDEGVAGVVCGQDHTLFITVSGRLLSCGWGADGQTGVGHFQSTCLPRPVVGDVQGERITRVAGAADCVLAINDGGDVFGWGNSEYGQLGSVTAEPQLAVPRRLPLGVGRVRDVASAGTMCAAIDEGGDVHVWGYGLLGKGPALEVSLEPTAIPASLFGRNQFSPESRATAVSCGLYHLAVVNSSGSLFTWGHNRHGSLGLGHCDDRLFPLRVSLPARVIKVACGVDHMAALCREFF